MSNYIELVISIGAPLYIMAVVLYTIRLIRGPTIPDMVLAVDCLAYD